RRRSAAGSLSGLPRLRNTENTEAPMIATGWSSRSTGAWVEPHSTVLTEGAACPRGFRCALGACSIRCLTGQVSTDRRWSRRLPPPPTHPAHPPSPPQPHQKKAAVTGGSSKRPPPRLALRIFVRPLLGGVAEFGGETHQVGVGGAHQCVAELAITPQ